MKKVISMVCLTVWFLSAVQVFASGCAKGGCCTPKTTASFACVMPECDVSANATLAPAKGIVPQSKLESLQVTFVPVEFVEANPIFLHSTGISFSLQGSPPTNDPFYIRYHQLLI